MTTRTMTTRTVLTPFFLGDPLPRARRLVRDGWVVNDPEVTGDQFARTGSLLRGLADLVAQAVADGLRPVSVGGDCCQAIAVVAGLRRSGIDPVLLWLDAHGDFNTAETSPSGFVGGMPLAMLTGRGDQRLLEAVRVEPLSDADVVLTDARDLDPLERVALEASAVRRVPALDAVVAALPPARPIYVHFDVDLIDPADAPAVDYPAPGGPPASAVRTLFGELARMRHVVAASVTLWNLEREDDTGAVCLDTLAALTPGGPGTPPELSRG